MKSIYFNAYKISQRIPVSLISSLFGLPAPESWENHVILGSSQLNSIFKFRTHAKQVLLFDFGSVVFVNFNTEEIRIFLHYLESVIEGVDYDMFARYSERQGIRIFGDGSFSLYKDHRHMNGYSDRLIPVIASVLAKSSALSFIENSVKHLMDEAESFISYMNRGILRSKDRKYASVTAHILRFRFESTASIRIFDRPSFANASLLSREVYDSLSDYYELSDRFNILDSKTRELGSISRSYSRLSYQFREQRLFLFEVFLLALFPLSYLLEHVMDAKKVQGIFELFLK